MILFIDVIKGGLPIKPKTGSRAGRSGPSGNILYHGFKIVDLAGRVFYISLNTTARRAMSGAHGYIDRFAPRWQGSPPGARMRDADGWR